MATSEQTSSSQQVNMGVASMADGPGYPRRQVILTMVGLLLALLFAELDGTIVNTALPRIVGEFHGFDRYAWVATAYTLAATVMIPIYGKLSDLVGRKVIFLLCLVIFLLGAALSGAAQSMNQLIAFRAFQGFGAGGIMPVAMAAVADLLTPRQRAQAQGAFMSMIGISTILGPILGGWITDHASWRWVFYVNLPVGLVALLTLIVLMPSLRHTDARPQIDITGAALLLGGLVPLLLGLTWAGTLYAWRSWQTAALLGGGLALVVLFVRHEAALERRGGESIVAPSLFANRAFTVSLLTVMIAFMGIMGCMAFLPLYAQGVLRVSATNSGLVLAPMMLAVIASSTIAGQVAARTGSYRAIGVGGMVLGVLGSGLMLRLDLHTSYADMVVAIMLLGLGLGCCFTSFSTIVMSALPARKRGQGMASFDFFQEMGGPLALGILGPMLAERYGPAYRAALGDPGAHGIPARLVDTFERPDVLLNPQGLHAISAQFAGNGRAVLTNVLEAVRAGLSESIHTVFLASFAIFIAGLLVVMFLPHVTIVDATEEEVHGEAGTSDQTVTARRSA